MVENIRIKYIPTGIVFNLPKKEVDELKKNDRDNYEVLDENYIEEVEKEPKETSLYNQTVVTKNGTKEDTGEKTDTTKRFVRCIWNW
ncbi:MAG: hypothetical protein NC311_11640 [Muribaculaceae bacterium]|nr:hypothetical protein [Muribaculaceae bacterium]